MWLYASGNRSSKRIILYDYQKSRASRHAKNFLEGYTGYLQTDGYAGYNGLGEVKHMACMAHYPRYIIILDEQLRTA
jgi:transposase